MNPGSPGSNSLRIKLPLNGSNVVLIGFKATVLTKIVLEGQGSE
jgi:hypothetical protein